MSEPGPILFPPSFEVDDEAHPPRCLSCGYQLDGLTEPRCPECGTPFDPAVRSTYTRHPGFLFWKYWMPGLTQAALGAAVISYLFLANNAVGWGLSLATPFALGAILGYGVRGSVRIKIILCLMAIVFVVGTMIFANVAGPLCGLILTVLFLVPTGVGIMFGSALRHVLKESSFDQRFHLPVVLFLMLLPAVAHGAERLIHLADPPETLSTSRTITSTLRRAWQAGIFTSAKSASPFAIGGEPYPVLPAPRALSMRGDHSIPGGTKHVTFNRGRLDVQVTDRQEMRLIAFRFVGQNHLEDRAVRLLDGRMEFASTEAPERTRITLTTRYQPLMTPRWYWRPFERMTGEKVHAQILTELEQSAARAARESDQRAQVVTTPPAGR